MNKHLFFRILMVGNHPDELSSLGEMISANFQSSIDLAFTSEEAMLQIDYHTYDMIMLDAEIADNAGIKLQEYVHESFLNGKSLVLNIVEGQLKNNQWHDQTAFYIEKPVGKNDLMLVFQFHIRHKLQEQEFNMRLQEEEKKKQLAENEIQKSEERFKNIVEKNDAGILIIDDDGTIQFINEAGEKIFLRKKEELVGHQFGSITDYDKRTEIDIVRKNGEIGIGEVTTAMTEWKGKPAKLLMINDITNHKKLEESLEIAMQKAQESDRLKTAFLANMSHEIRTPLNGILGFSQLMDNENLATEQRRFYIESITSCGNYLLNIISDMVDIAQIESGQLQVTASNFDVIQLVREIYEMYKINSKVVSKNLELRLEHPNIQSLVAHSDPSRLKQVIINLINNAVKFTEKGKITVGFTLENNNLQFYVKDTGKGIPQTEFENIFLRFRQLEAPKNKVNEGNGLGLSISKALVGLLGGTIWLESEIDAGSAFYFTIPLSQTQDPPVEKRPRNFRAKAVFKDKKILVVEDDENNFYFIEAIIKSPDTTIFWAKNGEEAVQIANKENIDLILMDMKLPIKSGFEAVREIRRQKPDLPIIAQTAYAMSNDKEKVLAVGCNDYIAKPIKVNELICKMNTLLN